MEQINISNSTKDKILNILKNKIYTNDYRSRIIGKDDKYVMAGIVSRNTMHGDWKSRNRSIYEKGRFVIGVPFNNLYGGYLSTIEGDDLPRSDVEFFRNREDVFNYINEESE